VGKPTAQTRARAKELDSIVAGIARMFVEGTWRAGESAKALAKEHGVQPSRVEEWAAEAGRLLRIVADADTYKAINVRRLDETYATAEDGKARVAAIAEQNKMLGLHAPAQVKVDVTVQAYAKLSDAEWLEAAEKHHAQLGQAIEAMRGRLAAKALPAGVPEVIAVEVEDERTEE
jgi:hypothetical protein